LIQREMGRSDFPVKRASPLALVAAAGLLVWLAFAVVTPYVYRHQPGPRNPSFGWYMLYQSLPLLILAAVFVLVFFALRLWKPWPRPQIPAIAAAVTTVVMFLGAMLVVFSRG
jgi:putative flippase GtrA